jgi:hypothetical protein
MKTNKFTELINFGLSQKTLMTLSENEINTLHKNLVEGKKTETKEQGTTTTGQGVTAVSSKNPNAPTIAKNLNKQGVNVQMTEKEETDEKSQPKNPWAICHAQLGPKKTAKFERCVKQVKKSISEGKNPFSVILENKIVSLLEKHVQPKMMKKELLDLIGKNKMKKPIGKMSSLGMMENDIETAPTKPVTKPGTKTPPKPEPFDPFKPKPGTNPNPKAKKKKTETKEADAPTIAPTKPVTKPGTKTPPKPEPFDPFKPKPGTNPNPKAKTKNKLPNWLSFKNLGLNLK